MVVNFFPLKVFSFWKLNFFLDQMIKMSKHDLQKKQM